MDVFGAGSPADYETRRRDFVDAVLLLKRVVDWARSGMAIWMLLLLRLLLGMDDDDGAVWRGPLGLGWGWLVAL